MERMVSKSRAFKGRLLELEVIDVETEAGRLSVREVVRHPGASAVLIIRRSTSGDEPEILLVRQYRKAIERYTWEIPAGKLSLTERGLEDPLSCALREIWEETGLKLSADKLLYLGYIYTTPGFTDEIIHLWMAEVSADELVEPQEVDEITAARWVTLSTLKRMILRGDLRDSKSLSALLHLLLRKES